MARTISSSQSDTVASDLEDYERYEATLSDWQIVGGNYGDQLQVTWALDRGGSIRDWLGLRLGSSTDTGKVSKLRQCLNAMARRPEIAPVWFTYPDQEGGDYTWGYEGEPAPFSNLNDQLRVVLVGKNGQNKEGLPRYTVQAYLPVGRRPAPKVQQPAPRRPTITSTDVQGEVDDPDGIPF